MFRHYSRLSREWDQKGKLSLRKRLDLLYFHNLWLAMLFVVAEGFADKLVQNALEPWMTDNLTLRVHWSSVGHQMGQLGDKLKKFRNATFHYQSNADKHLHFLRAEGRHRPLSWAEDLHNEFRMLFSEYRVSRMAEEMSRDIKRKRETEGSM